MCHTQFLPSTYMHTLAEYRAKDIDKSSWMYLHKIPLVPQQELFGTDPLFLFSSNLQLIHSPFRKPKTSSLASQAVSSCSVKIAKGSAFMVN